MRVRFHKAEDVMMLGAYLFGGIKGLEAALDAYEEDGTNWLELFIAGKVSVPE